MAEYQWQLEALLEEESALLATRRAAVASERKASSRHPSVLTSAAVTSLYCCTEVGLWIFVLHVSSHSSHKPRE